MTAGGEGGARARPPPSHSAAARSWLLAGRPPSTSRAWPAPRGARPLLALAARTAGLGAPAWGLARARRPFPLAPRPFQAPASLRVVVRLGRRGAWGSQLRPGDVVPRRAAASPPPHPRLRVALGHPSRARPNWAARHWAAGPRVGRETGLGAVPAPPGSRRAVGGRALPCGGFLAPRRAEGARVGGGKGARAGQGFRSL